MPHLAVCSFENSPHPQAESADWVVVQGDTTPAAITALGAFYQRAKVAHVEAGLRSIDDGHHFPEEINRRVTGEFPILHFAPTEQSRTITGTKVVQNPVSWSPVTQHSAIRAPADPGLAVGFRHVGRARSCS